MAWAAVTAEFDVRHGGYGAPVPFLHDKTANSGAIPNGCAVVITLASGKISQAGTGGDAAGIIVVGVAAGSVADAVTDRYLKVWRQGYVWMKKASPVQTDVGKLAYPDLVAATGTDANTVILTAPTNVTGALGRITQIDAPNGLVEVELAPAAIAAGNENA